MRSTNHRPNKLSATDGIGTAGLQVSAEISPRFGSDLRAVDPAAYRAALAAGARVREGSAILRAIYPADSIMETI